MPQVVARHDKSPKNKRNPKPSPIGNNFGFLSFGSPCWVSAAKRTLCVVFANGVARCGRLAQSGTQATYSHAAGVARGKFASQSLHLFLPLVGAACCYASNPTEKKTKSRPPIGDLLFVGSPCWARTSDNLINSQVLYRLS